MKVQEITSEKFKSKELKVGDCFCEHLSFWVYIIRIEDGKIITIEGSNPGVIKEYEDFDAFEKKFSYKVIDGYWIDYMGFEPCMIPMRIKKYKSDMKSSDHGRKLILETIIYDL